MTYLDTWRTNLKTHLAEFAPLAKEDRAVNIIYGITATAVLWGVRDAPFNDEQKTALKEAAGDDKHLPHLLRALGGWDVMTQLEAARALQKRQAGSPELREAITAVLGTFIEELMAHNAVEQVQTFNIEGSISGGNIVIGGYQVVAGDLIIQYIRPVVSTCPTAPKPPDHFAGREHELRELRDHLTGDEVVAITAVRAMGGMGKTTLAQALCHQPDKPFDAVLWANIGENPQVTSILLEWARYAVDDYPLQPDSKPEQIAAWVRGQMTQLMGTCGARWLVVFDDVWNTPPCYQAVAVLQTALPVGIKTLMTTRQADAASYLRAKSVELYELNDADALTLLHNLRDNRHLTDAHLQRTVDIVKGHPLTLELAAASLNDAEDPADIDAILDEYERGVRDGSPFDAMTLGVETPRALNVVFGRSYNALLTDDQQQFRALGVLAPDAVWNRSLGGALWALDDDRALTAAHKTLRLAAFMRQDEEAEQKYGGVYYTQHPLLRSYARALLNRAGETDTAFNRYADHVIGVAKQFRTLPREQWGTLDADLPHVDYVGDTLAHLWDALTVGTGLAQSAAPLVGEGDSGGEGLTRRCADFAWNVKDYVYYRPQMIDTDAGRALRGLNWLETGLAVYRQQGNQQREATTLNNIGLAWFALGEKRKALAFYELALPLLRAVGDRSGEATTLTNIGSAWDALGEKRKALAFFERALPLRQAVGDRGGEATTLNNIGLVWSAVGGKRKALAYYEQALPLVRAVGDRGGEATTLNNMAAIYYQNGDLDKAASTFQQVADALHQVGAVAEEATLHSNIAVVLKRLGRVDEAITHVEQAIALLNSKKLPRTAGGRPVADLEAHLARLRGESAPANPVMDAIRTLFRRRK